MEALCFRAFKRKPKWKQKWKSHSAKNPYTTRLFKKLNLDAIHDTVHEMAKDEARHGRAFQGFLDRYFK